MEKAKNIDIETWTRANEESLIKQSRSFAIPILRLDDRFRIPVMVEYNLNKAMDTIEDSTVLGTDEKIALMKEFCEGLEDDKASINVQERMLQVTPEEEVFVFRNYNATINLFKTLQEEERILSKRWITEMAEGMCLFLRRSIEDLNDLNQYCYYVAGTVGIYLTGLLGLKGSNATEKSISRMKETAVPFGLFLQKLNIIRDYIEDRDIKKRSFWPKTYFSGEEEHVNILNHMCHETLEKDVPGAIEYFSNIPQGNGSYDNFIRFILCSGLEYLKILKDNRSVFSRIKVKLPRVFIKRLYEHVSKQSRKEFEEYCKRLYSKEVEHYRSMRESLS